MCGIQGLFSPGKEISPTLESAFKKALNLVQHRGPDGANVQHLSHYWMGHQRLSIIDLREIASQPMQVEQLWIIFNGEIYNYLEIREELKKQGHVFKTDSDTEVLARAYLEWGLDCFSKFNGMWAIAIWDEATKQLVLSRDRMGVKPLYYTITSHGMLFGSEIKQLLEFRKTALNLPTQLRWNKVAEFLDQGLAHYSEETLFEDIYLFKPACFAVLKQNEALKEKPLSSTAYWDFPSEESFFENNPSTYKKVADELLECLDSAVTLRLRSDVAVGSALSGGIDSSSVVKLIAKKNPLHQKTVSACFPGFPNDETAYIEKTLQNTSIESIKVYPQVDDLISSIDKLTFSLDGPFHSTSMWAQCQVFKASQENNLKVMLDGQGADELFCGYEGYFKSVLATSFLGGVRFFFNNRKYFFNKMGKHQPQILLNSLLKMKVDEKNAPQKIQKKYIDPLKEHLYQTARTSSLPSLLHYEDRNSMAYSVESRTPFLDYRIVELAFRCPSTFHVYDGNRKSLLRRAVQNTIPAAILNRKDKNGFSTPQDQWRAAFTEKLKAPLLKNLDTNFFNHDAVSEALSQENNWRLITLLKTIEVFNVEI